jgi:hypothetical protein
MEELTVAQRANKFPAFLWAPKAHSCVHSSPPLARILSHTNSPQNFTLGKRR